MPQRTIEFDRNSNAYIIRDLQSKLQAVLHTQQPVPIQAATALDAAEIYLNDRAQLLGLDPSELRSLRLPPLENPIDVLVEYRFLSEKRQFDVTTVTFQQTGFGLSASKAGISVHLKKLPNHFEVLSLQSTRDETLTPAALMALRDVIFPDLSVNARIDAGQPGRGQPGTGSRHLVGLLPVDPQVLARQLGIADKETPFDAASLTVTRQRTMIYRYDPDKRARTLQGPPTPQDKIDPYVMPLPPIPAGIVDGSQNAVAAVYFDLERKGRSPTHWLALVEARTYSVLYLEEFVGGINGMVFLADPVTTHGGPLPGATDAQLNPVRVQTVLQNLEYRNPPELIGRHVKIVNFEDPISPRSDLDPPTGNPDFKFDVRTNKFAALNAYFNCDRFFTLVENLGFKRDDYFPGTAFPITVDHRGWPTNDPTWETIDAQCRGTPSGDGLENVVFALAELDAPTPIGLACDWRVVLHELGGHAVLYNHIGSASFNFAHSAGDSLAAILNDPESKARDKGATFPWTIARFRRRHDCTVADGYGWDGLTDRQDGANQLKREQILSSTHLRLYKSIGGDNPGGDPRARLRAARSATYLILRAIQTLTPATNPNHASDWFCNLVVADATDWTSEGFTGGAYEKVIYWAFEKQGLFGGNPPLIDVYIDDGMRHGEYQYQADYSHSPAIWNRHAADGNVGHQPPVPNVVNFAYVKIKNRGSQAATSVVVDAFKNNSQTRRNYPDDWAPMRTPRRSASDLPPQSPELTVGPFEWIPSAGDNYILMAVSADGDASNLRKFTAGQSIEEGRLVPNDNNLALRKV